MKKMNLILFHLLYFGFSFSQTAIGKNTVSSPSVILDFGTGTTRGIIIPSVETLPSTPANGTFVFFKGDDKVKVFQNETWLNLSDAGSETNVVPYTNSVDTDKQTIIGSHTTSVDGVFVLESTNKAMVLPHVANPHLTVKSPYPGMMCYDTASKSLAVFDGVAWSYWK